ncbi:uncharacterized protein LOC100680153 isoform X1 [Nasonia vitripennis]|uniref:Regulatory protein zeste n=1 Tax=Nasonia vitripennis TaxID=7425 RepID=A0A7M7Q4R0_NASVI|nr:uncharacterized protein LOC100680153 isoform X1 [Nasonia vitripennis]
MAPRPGRTRVWNRMSNIQMETLITYMEQHTLFARGQIPKLGSQGQVKYRKMWMELCTTLNGMGPCITDVKGWQEKWTRMRLSAKSQKAQFNRAWNKTGHDEQTIVLSSNNERISGIFGKYGSGVNIGRELGFSKCTWVRKTSQEAPTCPRTCDDELDWLEDFHSVCFGVSPIFQEIPKHMEYFMKIFDENRCSSIFLAMQRKKGKGKQPIQKPSLSQMLALVDVIERHLEIVLDHPGDDTNHATWEVVALFANKADEDGVQKNGKSWRKTWCDFILSAKQNVYLVEQNIRQNPLPDHHMKAIQIVTRAEQVKSSSARRTQVQQNNAVVSRRLSSSSALKRARMEGNPAGFGDEDGPSTSSGYRSATSYVNRHLPTAALPTAAQPSSPWSTNNAGTTTATTTSSSNICSNSTAGTTSAAEKSSAFIKAFDSKIKELVDVLAAQFIACFEQQNVLLQNCFAKQNELLLKIQTNDLVNDAAQDDEDEVPLPDNPQPSSPRNAPVVEEETEETEYTIQEKCPICLDVLTRPAIIPRCAHVFCYECIYEWVDKELECPLCRIIINTFDIAELP